jgi:phage tail sheath protein FI
MIYKTPGVYIEEISTLPPSVAPVATAIPGIVGYTRGAGTLNGNALPANTPMRLNSLLEFEDLFGGQYGEEFIATLTDAPNGTTDIAVAPSGAGAHTIGGLSKYLLHSALQMYFENGGGPCWVVSVGTFPDNIVLGSADLTSGLRGGVKALEQIDEVTLLVVPELQTLNTPNRKILNDFMLDQCNSLQDRFAILDVKVASGDAVADADSFRDEVSLDYLKYGAAYYPSLKTVIPYKFSEQDVTIVDARATNPFDTLTLDIVSDGTAGVDPDKTLHNDINKALSEFKITVYPSSAIAGVYAKIDRDRGVWKAPANTSVRMASAPSVEITSEEQENLNVDANSGKSVNAIRNFTGKGLLVWGARTLAGNDNEWRYVPVRRLYIFVEESTKKASESFVFEPNDANTWALVKGMIENFLTQLWRDGALAGAKPEHAFFVKVGLGETMSAQDILEGRMNVEIGLAAVRPAEFIILKFSHKMQES